jgi:hypothetical protein
MKPTHASFWSVTVGLPSSLDATLVAVVQVLVKFSDESDGMAKGNSRVSRIY